MDEIVVLWSMVGALGVIATFLSWRLQLAEQKLQFALKTIEEFRKKVEDIRIAAELVKVPLTRNHEKAQDSPQKLNAASARKRMESVNREFFSADRKVANSDILKEN